MISQTSNCSSTDVSRSSQSKPQLFGLLSEVLDETAVQADIEEQLLATELRKRDENLLALRITNQKRLQEAGMAAIELEQRRRDEWENRRVSIQSETLVADVTQEPGEETTQPQTNSASSGNYESVVLRQTAEVVVETRPRVALLLSALVALLAILGTAIALLSSGAPPLDQTTYEQSALVVTSPASQVATVELVLTQYDKPAFVSRVVAVSADEPDDDRRDRSEQRDRSSLDRHDDDERSDRDEQPDSYSTPLEISLDGGTDIFSHGSE